jgi:hypothetical protein
LVGATDASAASPSQALNFRSSFGKERYSAKLWQAGPSYQTIRT